MPRKKGSLNQTTRETKEFLNLVVKNEHVRIEAALLDLFGINKASYLHAITKLCRHHSLHPKRARCICIRLTYHPKCLLGLMTRQWRP